MQKKARRHSAQKTMLGLRVAGASRPRIGKSPQATLCTENHRLSGQRPLAMAYTVVVVVVVVVP